KTGSNRGDRRLRRRVGGLYRVVASSADARRRGVCSGATPGPDASEPAVGTSGPGDHAAGAGNRPQFAGGAEPDLRHSAQYEPNAGAGSPEAFAAQEKRRARALDRSFFEIIGG